MNKIERWCCVNIRDLRLQYAIQKHSDFLGGQVAQDAAWTYQGEPLAVVSDERPTAKIVACTERAKRLGVTPGLSAVEATARCEGLRVVVIHQSDVEHVQQTLLRTLQQLSPDVEISAEHEGVFWLNASGLENLYGSLDIWANRIRKTLKENFLARLSLEAAVVVGTHRLSTWALSCRAIQPVMVFNDLLEEQAQTHRVRLCDVLPARDRNMLDRLGVFTIGDLAKLSPSDVKVRLGQAAAKLQQLALGGFSPLLPAPHHEPVNVSSHFDHALTHTDALLEVVEAQLKGCAVQCSARYTLVQSFSVALIYERHHHLQPDAELLTITPAVPTRDVGLLHDLFRLKLSSHTQKSAHGIVRCDLNCEVVAVVRAQESLWAESKELKHKRDPHAGMRAVARVKALCGDDAVVKPGMGDGHLPERSVTWQTVTDIQAPLPTRQVEVKRNLVRRMWRKPKPMSMGRAGIRPLLKCAFFSGGWWRRDVRREYFYVEYPDGDIRWVFFDWLQRRWFEHGQVT